MIITYVVVQLWFVCCGLPPERKYWTEFDCKTVIRNIELEMESASGGSYILDCTEYNVAPWREK